jgi:plastocyanin
MRGSMKTLTGLKIISLFGLGGLMVLLQVLQSSKLPVQGGEKMGTLVGRVQHPSMKKYPGVVYIEEIPGKEFKPPERLVEMNQKEKTFIPRVLPILVGTQVDFLNSDDFKHSILSPEGKYNLGFLNKGEKRSYTFKRPGIYTQLCSLHPEMVAYVVVVKTPYFAVTDPDGKFKIDNVPIGTWKLKVWNELLTQNQLDKTYEVKIQESKETSVELEP